jgi:beta-ketoacyl synthase-like protein
VSQLSFDLHAAAVLAPGLSCLDDLRAACRSGQLHEAVQPPALSSPEVLPANERRRASQVVRLTLSCIEQALMSSPFETNLLRCVFATDEGSGEICQQMLEALATTRQMSPLLFSNSVLNAPSGYFSIGYRNRQSATVVSVGLESFAAGLVCAVTEAWSAGQPVLLVSYDPKMTAPMDALLPIGNSTASAWVLSAGIEQQTPKLASFAIDIADARDASPTLLPSWIPAAWSAQSSSFAFAALGLLEEQEKAELLLRWNGLMLSVRRKSD